MRPIKLTMQAFGPYAGRVTVDFDKLGNSGIYLITGDTGAGKSTIFDGITYALFDKTSLEERQPSSLRSMYAAKDVNTEVELTFSYDGKQYTIKRTPQYEYKTRNDTTATKNSTVELTLADGKVYTGNKTETDNKISEIIGLEYGQFRRIVMIAQGDFKQLLLDRKGRVEIFRKIFDTSPYLRLQDSLKEERKILKNVCASIDKEIKLNINDFRYDEKDELNVELEEIKGQDSYNMPMISKLVLKMNDKDEKEINNIKDDLNKLDEDLAKFNKELGEINKIKDIQNKLTSANKQKQLAEETYKKVSSEGELIKKQKVEIDKNRKELALLEKELDQYKDLDKRQKDLNDAKKELNSLNEKYETLEKNNIAKKKQLEENKKEVNELKNIDLEYQKSLVDLKEKKESLNQLNDLEIQVNEYLKLKNNVTIQEDDYLKVSELAQKAIDEYNNANKLFLDNQAGVLARTLVDNKPCPVCGSLNHPNCAKSIDSAPSENELKKLKKVMDDESNNQKKKSEALSKLRGQLETSKDSLIKQTKKLLDSDVLDDVSTLLENKKKEFNKLIEDLEAEIIKLTNKQRRKIALDKSIENSEKTIEEDNKQIAKIKEDIASNKTNIDNQDKEIKKLASSLRYESLDKAKLVFDDMNKRVNDFDKLSKENEDNFKKANDDLVKYKSLIKAYEDQLKGNTIKIDDELDDKIKQLNIKKLELNDYKDKINDRFGNNKRILKQIEKRYKEIEVSQKKLEWINVLCDTANGTLNQKDKISFETYIQMSYFDRILSFANVRLQIMTNGQYSFVRGKEGLELNVIDHYNGTVREVSTLSGGESFMASLSLALGMSDEVQSRTTSIQIDTLFVDEGFGSLDGDTLNSALNALYELSQGNRLVGIISHVEELKNRIDKKIIVSKDKANGSDIKYEI